MVGDAICLTFVRNEAACMGSEIIVRLIPPYHATLNPTAPDLKQGGIGEQNHVQGQS